jgi:basic amino acid/polyamine antiporter, APA family
MESARTEPRARAMTTAPQAFFGLWDTICIMVGIIIGAGIFKTPSAVFALSGGPVQALAVWVAGGLLAIVGAFCFAELASTYPRSGGEYVYLTRAFGPWAGFLFAWGQLLIIRTGASMVAVAYVFATYASRLIQLDPNAATYPFVFTGLALLPIVVLTATNILGVRAGKWTQNTLTVVKVAGLGGVLVAGFMWARTPAPADEYVVYQGQVLATTSDAVLLSTSDTPAGRPIPLSAEAKITIDDKDKNRAGAKLQPDDVIGLKARVLARASDPTRAVRIKATEHSLFGGLSLALIFVLWTYAGWHEGGYIAAEVRNPRRNLPLALLLGTAAVIGIYLLINVSYLVGLGFDDAADSPVVAAEVLALAPWTIAEQAICVLIMISALGAINGCIFTSSRIFSEFGADHSLFAPLGRWSRHFGTPATALLVQGAISVGTIFMVVCFFQSQDSFDVVVKGTAPVFWLFFLLTGVALFALRRAEPDIKRPFSVPLYPLTPLVYCAICGLMLYGSVMGAFEEALGGWMVALTFFAVISGLPLHWLSRRRARTVKGIQTVEPGTEGAMLSGSERT